MDNHLKMKLLMDIFIPNLLKINGVIFGMFCICFLTTCTIYSNSQIYDKVNQDVRENIGTYSQLLKYLSSAGIDDYSVEYHVKLKKLLTYDKNGNHVDIQLNKANYNKVDSIMSQPYLKFNKIVVDNKNKVYSFEYGDIRNKKGNHIKLVITSDVKTIPQLYPNYESLNYSNINEGNNMCWYSMLQYSDNWAIVSDCK